MIPLVFLSDLFGAQFALNGVQPHLDFLHRFPEEFGNLFVHGLDLVRDFPDDLSGALRLPDLERLGRGRRVVPPLIGAVVVLPNVALPLAQILGANVLDADAALVYGRPPVAGVLELRANRRHVRAIVDLGCSSVGS